MPVSTPCRAFAEKAGLCGNEMGWRRSVPGHILLQLKGRGEVRVLTIELTRGLSWSEPVETIDCRKCETTSIEFAAAEALHYQHRVRCRGSSALAARDPEDCPGAGCNPLQDHRAW